MSIWYSRWQNKGANMESFDICNSNFMSASLYRSYATKTPIKSITIVKNDLINRQVLKSVTLDSSTVGDLDGGKIDISMKIKV